MTTALDGANADLVGRQAPVQPPPEDNYNLSDEEIAARASLPVPPRSREQLAAEAAERARRQRMADETSRRYDEITARDQGRREAAGLPGPPAPRPVVEESDPGPQRGEGFGVRGRGQTSDDPDAILSQGDISALGRAGTWIDPQDDQEYTGIRVRGGLFTGNLSSRNPNNPAEVHGSVLSGDAGVYSTDETLTMSAGVSAVDVGCTVPTDGDFSANRDDDLSIGFQGGIGPGAALRIHHGGDRDNDGVEELGFGVSAMDFGFDVRSETLGRHAQSARRNLTRWGENLSSWFDDPQEAPERPPGDPVT